MGCIGSHYGRPCYFCRVSVPVWGMGCINFRSGRGHKRPVSVPVWGMGCIGKTVQICRIRLVKFLQLVFDIIAQNPLHDKEFCPLSTKTFLLVWQLSGANLSLESKNFWFDKGGSHHTLQSYLSILICCPQNIIACAGLASIPSEHAISRYDGYYEKRTGQQLSSIRPEHHINFPWCPSVSLKLMI